MDALSSLTVQQMTTEEFGAYWLLIMNGWVQTPQAELPNDIDILRAVTRLTPKRFDAFWKKYGKKFQKSDDKVWNPRQMDELDKLKSKSSKRRNAGQKGAAARWQTDGNAMANACDRNANAMPIDAIPESESESESEVKPPIPRRGNGDAVFEAFWTEYPKKASKGQARKTWDKIVKQSPDIVPEIMAGIKTSPALKRDDLSRRPNPSTWLNALGWLDDPDSERQETFAERAAAEVFTDDDDNPFRSA